MRTLVWAIITCGPLLAAAPLHADDAAGKALDKALKAHGNPSGKDAGYTWTGKGTFYGMGDGVPYTGTWAIQPPDKFRMEVSNAFTIVVNGDKGWISVGGMTQDFDKEQVAEQLESIHAHYVTRLYPLKDKAYTLSLVGDAKLDNKPAVAVKVSRKGHRDITLYFDKESGLLVKFDQTVKDEQTGGQEQKQESFIKDYVTVNGVKIPSRMDIKRDGKNYVDGEMTEFKTVEKLPDETFAKPQ